LFTDKLQDVLAKSIPYVANNLPVFFGCVDTGRVFQIPLLPPDSSGENRTGSFLLAITQHNYEGKTLTVKWIDALGLLAGNIDAQLSHGFNRGWVKGCGFATRAGDVEPISREIAEERLGHLSAARIPRAQKQHFRFHHRPGSYLQQARIASGLTALLRVQHSA
jgi:hypothetical protein